MHKNYNSCLHILDMHVEMGGGWGHQFSHRKQILVLVCFCLQTSTTNMAVFCLQAELSKTSFRCFRDCNDELSTKPLLNEAIIPD